MRTVDENFAVLYGEGSVDQYVQWDKHKHQSCKIMVKLGNEWVVALVDTGSSISLVNTNKIPEAARGEVTLSVALGGEPSPYDVAYWGCSVAQSAVGLGDQASAITGSCSVQIGARRGKSVVVRAAVMDMQPYALILGYDWLRRYKVQFDPDQAVLRVGTLLFPYFV